MNTPAHVLIGAAAFGRPAHRAVTAAAVVGALAPDVSLYLMAGTALFILSIPPQVVFDELYFSNAWQTVFAIDNSILVWGALLGLGLWRHQPVLVAFAAAGLAHIALDFPLHAGDGRPHFWPISDWVFDSPVSYWDSAHHAGVFAPLSIVVCVAAYAGIWLRWRGWRMRAGMAALLLAELWVMRQWLLFF